MALFVAMPGVMVPLPGKLHIVDWNGHFHLGRRLFDQSPLVTILLKVQPAVNIKINLGCTHNPSLSAVLVTGAVCPGSPMKGSPQTVPDLFKWDPFVSHIPVFIKGLVLLYFWLKSACSFALRFMLLTQITHNYLMWLLHSPLARAPYVVLFDLKLLIEDGNL